MRLKWPVCLLICLFLTDKNVLFNNSIRGSRRITSFLKQCQHLTIAQLQEIKYHNIKIILHNHNWKYLRGCLSFLAYEQNCSSDSHVIVQCYNKITLRVRCNVGTRYIWKYWTTFSGTRQKLQDNMLIFPFYRPRALTQNLTQKTCNFIISCPK